MVDEEKKAEDQTTIFRDRNGKCWDVALTVGACRRIDASDFSILKAEGVTILEPTEDFYNRLYTDASFLCAICWAIVYPDAEKNLGIPISDESMVEAETAFTEAWDERTVTEARAAFLKTFGDFFPDRKITLEVMGEQMKRTRARMELQTKAMTGALDKWADQETDKAFAQLRKELGEKSGESPESLGSIPAK